MYVAHLSLHDFRSYATAEVALEPGVTAFIGRNGQGKTNLVEALKDDTHLDKIAGYAADSGEGRWTVQAGIDHGVAMPAIAASLYARFVSQQDESPAMKAIAAMRNQFGGHAVKAGPPPGGDAATE